MNIVLFYKFICKDISCSLMRKNEIILDILREEF